MSDLAKIDNIDEDELKTVPVDLGKLRNVLNNEVIKRNWVW